VSSTGNVLPKEVKSFSKPFFSMEFNLFDLHDSEEDTNVRRLLRVYSVLPRFSETSTGEKAKQAKKVVSFLRQANEKLKKEVSPSWKNDWIESTGYCFSQSSYKDWFIGRASIPLIALEKLKNFGLGKEVDELMSKVDYISSTTRDIIKIPKKFSPDLLYLSGLILGDGCLSINHIRKENNLHYRVTITSGDENFLIKKVKPLFSDLFEAECWITKNTSQWVCWDLNKANKAIYRLLTKIIEIPNGKKSHKARIPSKIKALLPDQRIAFLAGLIDSDIGRRKGGLGTTFASKQIVLDLIETFSELDITAKSYGSHYKDNKYIQHDFSIPKTQIKRFKELLEQNYLPKRADRVAHIFKNAGVG
jgi:intein/homing endonuclease